MNSSAPDPLDIVWSPADREAIREKYRAHGAKAADAAIAKVPGGWLGAFTVTDYREMVIADWVGFWDGRVARAAAIMRSPEAVGRAHIARHLVVNTQHSATAALVILRGAGADIGVLPSGDARVERVAALRRSATIGGL